MEYEWDKKVQIRELKMKRYLNRGNNYKVSSVFQFQKM